MPHFSSSALPIQFLLEKLVRVQPDGWLNAYCRDIFSCQYKFSCSVHVCCCVRLFQWFSWSSTWESFSVNWSTSQVRPDHTFVIVGCHIEVIWAYPAPWHWTLHGLDEYNVPSLILLLYVSLTAQHFLLLSPVHTHAWTNPTSEEHGFSHKPVPNLRDTTTCSVIHAHTGHKCTHAVSFSPFWVRLILASD